MWQLAIEATYASSGSTALGSERGKGTTWGEAEAGTVAATGSDGFTGIGWTGGSGVMPGAGVRAGTPTGAGAELVRALGSGRTADEIGVVGVDGGANRGGSTVAGEDSNFDPS